jgi:site-specific recombinase XerD
VHFGDAWGNYRTHLLVEGDCAHATIIEYGSVLRRWNRHLDDLGVRWDAAGREHLDQFLGRPAASGRRRGQPLSVNRRRTDIIAIHGLYRYALAAGLIDRDPFALVRLPRRRRGRLARHHSFEDAQRDLILDAARDDPRLYLLCGLAYWGGLRRAEIAALDLADLHRTPWPGELEVVGKGGFERTVPLAVELRKAIDRHLGDRANLTAGPLVANHVRPGEPLQPGTVGDLLAAHIRRCGIDPGSAHWLRHTAATNAAAARGGANLFDVQQFLGHRDPGTTMGYVSRFKGNVRANVVDLLSDPGCGPEVTP